MTRDQELQQVRAEIRRMLDSYNDAGNFFWTFGDRRRYDELCLREMALLEDA